MKTKNKMIRIASLFMAMLIVSISCVTAVSAKADIPQNDVNVLKDAKSEKIVFFKTKDGSIRYAISWTDKNNPNRTDFAFVDQKDLIAKNLVSSTNLNDSGVVAAAISAAKYSFWNGSYAETYGSLTSGGIHIYLSPRDAPYVAGEGAAMGDFLGTVIGGLLTKNANAAAAVGLLVASAVATVYWSEENSNGSLDIWIPYTSIATYLVTGVLRVQICRHWYLL